MSGSGTIALVQFLLARFAEEEVRWRTQGSEPIWLSAQHGGRRYPVNHEARKLDEVRAKREMVELITAQAKGDTALHVLGPFAALYADHPDFRHEWLNGMSTPAPTEP